MERAGEAIAALENRTATGKVVLQMRGYGVRRDQPGVLRQSVTHNTGHKRWRPGSTSTLGSVLVERTQVELRLPPDIFDHNPQGFLQFLGLAGQSVGDDKWSVQLAHPGADLLTAYYLADELTGQRNFRLLENVPPHEVNLDTQLSTQLDEVRKRLVERASSGAGADLTALFHHIQVELLVAGLHALVPATEQAYAALGNVTFANSGERAFGNRSAHLVVGTEVLMRRIRLPAIIFRLDQDPQVIQRATAARAKDPETAEQLIFQSASNLFANIVGLSRYLGPLMGCLSPRFWCVCGQRPLSAILFSLGMDMNGIRADPMEPLQILPVSGPEPRMMPNLQMQSSAWSEAIH